jgi:23S rRNA pseudouridine1911/1915/1917 synthase
MKSFTVGPADEGARVDRFIADQTGCSRAEARRLLEEGQVKVDGHRAKKGLLLRRDARVELLAEPALDDADRRPLPQPELPLEVAWQDEAVVAMVKPIGMPSHPLKPGERGTLANALVARFPECALAGEDPREGGLAHRLDADTSGLLLAARSRTDWLALRAAFSDGLVDKEYWALVAGAPPERGAIEVPLRQAGKLVKPIPYGGEGTLSARTEYEVLARGGDVSLLRVRAVTGRMHQVRAHLAFIGHPLLGDALYGGPPAPAGTQGHFLHAAALRFPHPRDAHEVIVQARLPAERAKALQDLVGWTED